MKALVIYKKSVYDLYRNSADAKTQAYAESNEALQRSRDEQSRSLEQVLLELNRIGLPYESKCRGEAIQIKDYNLVIAVGGDGTILEIAHYIKDLSVPILGVNSDPQGSVGFFSFCRGDTLEKALQEIETVPRTTLPRMKVIYNDTLLPEYVLNDILIAHQNPAAHIRYRLRVDGKQVVNEHESYNLRSSGLLVAAPAGSTGWIYNEGGSIIPLYSFQMEYLERGVRHLRPQFAQASIEVRSLTREGKLYIDGEHCTYDFTVDDTITLEKGSSLVIIGDLARKQGEFEKGFGQEAMPRRSVDEKSCITP